MSNPERLVFERVGIIEEICVTPHSEEMDTLRAVGVPRERDIALVLSKVSDAWFSRFMDELQRVCVPRALVVSKVAERVEFLADVVGGDCDPGFGVDPEDSARLLELRNAIEEAFWWETQADQERGDYVARVREIGEKLWKLVNPPPSGEGRIEYLEKKLRTQRAELRRFNREALARKEGNVPLHVTHDRWLQKLHALEQKTALGTATVADCMAIDRLKQWLGANP